MARRISLFAKILFWFFVNLLIGGGIVWYAFDLDFRVGPDSVLYSRSPNRIPILGLSLMKDLSDFQVDRWSEELERYSGIYGVDVSIFDVGGEWVAGPRVSLPVALRARMVEQFGLRTDENHPSSEAQPGDHPGHDLFCRISNGHCPFCSSGGYGLPDQRHPSFKMKTSQPNFYWAVMRLPGLRVSPGSQRELVLVGRSSSVTGNGLFIDPTPWAILAVLGMIISTLLWIPMVRHLTVPIRQMTEVTEKIARGVFDSRVGSRRTDELGRLGRAINNMADRLALMIYGQKRFLGDAAHELASPLARMQLAIGLLEESVDEKGRQRVAQLKDDVEQMTELVNGLLSFSRSDSVSGRVTIDCVNLFDVIARVIDREVPDESIAISFDVPERIDVMADRDLVSRIFANLVRNAVRYAGHAGPIAISASEKGQFVYVTVADCGPGVPEKDIPQLFEPFFRVEQSRVREAGGVGLGLAIVKTAVIACGGTVSATNRKDGGFEVTVALPACTVQA
ncbi:MAG TPA: HAMP domain-containing sensor histidine kinase [Myxococcota bacterium]|nr:HAMP domain-containing sensor histidine kinase [Myxococcota bacterium]HOD00758.1 HAMP domain-containing sensor histidine kinase [Myxococcota bacterium]HPV03816.1 HAMP domain-containing sensor histidine kinase [Myxococcota bacterium]